MPGMPRKKGKATKIAYAILGKPSNRENKHKNDYVERRLLFDETKLIR